MTIDWISATGTSAVVTISWSGSWVGGPPAEDTHAASHRAVTVIVAVGTVHPALTGWFALDRKNTIAHDVPDAAGVHGVPASGHDTASAPGALTFSSASCASTRAHCPATDAVTATVTGASATHTHVSVFTTVAPDPGSCGFQCT